MHKTVFAALAAVFASVSFAEVRPAPPKVIFGETAERKAERLAWWTHDRFGMFIHFGLYSMLARHEWVRNKEHLANEEFDARYFGRFNPDLFDAKEWARRAKAAGMRYAVLTTKHHEGFCLWDSDVTDYKITRTPFGRDLVREFVDAFRAEGIRIGFYYSVIDWHHPDFTVDCTHPLRPKDKRDWTDEAFAKLNEGRDIAKYRAYMYAQVRELLTRYGRIDIIWYDFTQRRDKYGKTWKDWESVDLMRLTRELQPGIIVDNRLDLNDTEDGWDFVTPEQYKVACWPTVGGKRVPWETCQTFSGSWGYFRDETSWKNPHQLIELLIHTVAHGGNLIMNVGPTGRGEFDRRASDRLDAYAKWMNWNSRAIYGCTEAPKEFAAPDGTLLTWNPETKRLYIHLLDYPMERLPIAFENRIAYLQFLHDGSELQVKQLPEWQKYGNPDVKANGFIELPILKPAVEIPVIEVFVK